MKVDVMEAAKTLVDSVFSPVANKLECGVGIRSVNIVIRPSGALTVKASVSLLWRESDENA